MMNHNKIYCYIGLDETGQIIATVDTSSNINYEKLFDLWSPRPKAIMKLNGNNIGLRPLQDIVDEKLGKK